MSKPTGDPAQVEQLGGHVFTVQQRVFMRALQAAISEHSGPVCVDQIREHLGKSDSRVRSHLKALVKVEFVCCVGRSKVKRYVPSNKWFEDPEALGLGHLKNSSIGGACGNPGCTNLAEDLWKGKYLCRRCIMGCDDEEDMRRLRKEWLSGCAPGSPGRMLEDALGESKKKS